MTVMRNQSIKGNYMHELRGVRLPVVYVSFNYLRRNSSVSRKSSQHEIRHSTIAFIIIAVKIHPSFILHLCARKMYATFLQLLVLVTSL